MPRHVHRDRHAPRHHHHPAADFPALSRLWPAPPCDSVGLPMPRGRCARLTRRPRTGSLLDETLQVECPSEEPRRARRTLERAAPQDRHRRLARLRRDRVRARRRDRHQDARRRGHRQRRVARSPTRRSAAPTSPRRPTSRCSSQARDGDARPSTTPQFKAGVDDVVAQLEGARTPPRSGPRSPPATRARSPRTATSALVTFSIPGDDEQIDERVDASLAATAAAQRAHPDLRIEQFGDAQRRQGARRLARRRLPARGVPLASRSR